MIWTREEFVEKLRNMKKNDKKFVDREGLWEWEFTEIALINSYNKAIDDVLQMIKDVGGCFRK